MHSFLKVLSPDTSVCPACGKPNGCSMSGTKSEQDPDGAAEKCWCMAYPPVTVGSEFPKNVCLCERCLKQQQQSALGSEIAP